MGMPLHTVTSTSAQLICCNRLRQRELEAGEFSFSNVASALLSTCWGVARFSRCRLQQQESNGLQVKYPENFFLLRGNHECASINRIYGFYDECKRRYNIRLWKTFTDCFNCLPVAALVDEKVCHCSVLLHDLQLSFVFAL